MAPVHMVLPSLGCLASPNVLAISSQPSGLSDRGFRLMMTSALFLRRTMFSPASLPESSLNSFRIAGFQLHAVGPESNFIPLYNGSHNRQSAVRVDFLFAALYL